MDNEKKDVGEKITQHDRRRLKTSVQLVKAMCELSREKPIYRITVQELASKANVSRGTFYLHFSDIYDMYETIEKRALNNIVLYFQDYMETFTDDAYERFLVNTVRFVEHDRELFRMLFSMQSFREQITDILDNFYMEAWKKFYGEDVTAKCWESMILYHTHGILACVDKWLNEDPAKTKEELLGLLLLLDANFDDMTEKNCLNPEV